MKIGTDRHTRGKAHRYVSTTLCCRRARNSSTVHEWDRSSNCSLNGTAQTTRSVYKIVPWSYLTFTCLPCHRLIYCTVLSIVWGNKPVFKSGSRLHSRLQSTDFNYIHWYSHFLFSILDTVLGQVSQHSVCLDWTTGVRSPAEAKDFSCSLCIQTSCEAHSAFYRMGTGGPFPGDKARPGRDANHSPTSNAEVKKLYSSPPCRLHGGSGTVLFFKS
jgi:hypothetical protein